MQSFESYFMNHRDNNYNNYYIIYRKKHQPINNNNNNNHNNNNNNNKNQNNKINLNQTLAVISADVNLILSSLNYESNTTDDVRYLWDILDPLFRLALLNQTQVQQQYDFYVNQEITNNVSSIMWASLSQDEKVWDNPNCLLEQEMLNETAETGICDPSESYCGNSIGDCSNNNSIY